MIKNELALIDGNWREWTFKEFLETLEKWTINNPLQGSRKQKSYFNREEKMHTPHGCVYCTSTEHRAVNCTKVTDASQRRSILASKHLCFNCTGPHRAALCESQTSCHTWKGKHHTSICEKPQIVDRSSAWQQRLLLEGWHSLRDTNAINEHSASKCLQ